MSITRRRVVSAAAASTSMLFAPNILRAQGTPTLKYATLNAGVSVVFDEFLKARRFDQKNGLNIELSNVYSSVPSYYSDFIAGSFNLAIGAWDSFAGMHAKSVPIKLVSTFMTADIINIVANADGPKTAKDLVGKPLAAIVATGAYAMCKATLQKKYGIELGKDVPVQNVPNPAQAVAMVVARNVDAALSWEPNIIGAFEKRPDMHVVFNVGREYQETQKRPLPYFGMALRDSASNGNPDIAKRVDATCRDLVAAINADPAAAYAYSAPKLGLKVEDMVKAHEDGRLKFLHLSMADKDGREAVTAAQAFINPNLPPIKADFFPA